MSIMTGLLYLQKLYHMYNNLYDNCVYVCV